MEMEMPHFYPFLDGEHWVLSGNSLDAVLLQELGEKPRRKKKCFPWSFLFSCVFDVFQKF